MWPASGDNVADLQLAARVLLTRRERSRLVGALSATKKALEPADHPILALAPGRRAFSREIVLVCVTPVRVLIAGSAGVVEAARIDAIREASSRFRGRQRWDLVVRTDDGVVLEVVGLRRTLASLAVNVIFLLTA